MDKKAITVPRYSREKLKKIKIRPDDLIQITFPKSGTHWLKHIIRLLLNDGEDNDSIPDEYRGGYLEYIVAEEDDDPSVYVLKKVGHPDACLDMEAMKLPRYFATHMPIDFLPEDLLKAKIIYLARNPKDKLVSRFEMMRRLDENRTVEKDRELFSQMLEAFITNARKLDHGYWHEHVLTWWHKRNEENVLFLKYEDMLKDLASSVKTIGDFIGKDPSTELINKIVHLASFEAMKQNPPKDHEFLGKALNMHFKPGESVVIRQGKVGGWKDYFTVAQNEYFDEHYKKWMEGSGLDFDFE